MVKLSLLALVAIPYAAAQTCTPSAGSSDDTPSITSAIASCPSGTIVIPASTTYTIGSPLTFSGCNGCTLEVEGTLQVTDDFDTWNGVTAFIHIQDVDGATVTSKTGTGTIDGNGQAYWDYIVEGDTSYDRPNLVRVDGCTDFTMTNMYIKNSPQFHVVTAGSSSGVYYSDITLYSVSSSSNVAHNTDGFDIGPASYVTAENLHITNDDDCVVLKPGANYVEARNITCIGSHGLSVGSLGSSYGSDDTVQNSIFEDATLSGAAKAAGIKIYPAGPDHGTGTVTNVTWRNIVSDDCDYAFQVQTCYGEDESYCEEYGNTGTLTDIVVDGFSGTTTDDAALIDCPSDGTCDITITDWSVSGDVLCANTPSDLGISCDGTATG